MIKPEQYNEFGEIVEVKPPRTFERTMTEHDTHRIHETKDLFDSTCFYCRKDAEKRQKKWDKENTQY